MKRQTICIFTVVLLSLTSVGLAFGSDAITETKISAMQGQVELLKWLGGAVVGGLVAAVVVLFKCLQQSQQETLAKLLEDSQKSIESNHRLAEAIERVLEKNQ
jgi:hypothetical protein